MASAFWSVALLIGMLWPSRLIGWLDGAPLDQRVEALAVALLVPTLWYLNPGFLRTRTARITIAALAIWKIATWMLLTQSGWCGLVASRYPAPNDAYRLEPSWDARVLWSGTPPTCSAVVGRAYQVPEDFPAWTINVAYGSNYDLDDGAESVPQENPRPPDATYVMVISGSMRPNDRGVLGFDVGRDTTISGTIDDRRIPAQRDGIVRVPMDAGPHTIDVRLDLARTRWRFVPEWNGANLFRSVPTSVRPSSRIDTLVEVWGAWIAPLLIAVLVGAWIASAASTIQAPAALAWTVGSATAMFVMGVAVEGAAARLVPLALAGCLLVPVPERLRAPRGAFLLFGLPWLAFFCGRTLLQVGRFSVYTFGDDMLTFQRFAHRIFMDGYWLEGGERLFWWQPLYRWTTGVLHLAFGDSSVADTYWDAWGLLIAAMFAFEVVRRLAGFRFAIATGLLTLITVTAGPNWYIVGRGLGDISAAAWIYLAAFALLRSRDTNRVAPAVCAGLFAALAFLTRLNHLPLVIAMAAIIVTPMVTADSTAQIAGASHWWSVRPTVAYLSCIGAAVTAFAARTWYYTGHFSVLAGTTISHNGTGLGQTISSFASAVAWRRGVESVLMIVTVQDPPRFDIRAVLVIGGVVAAIGWLLRAPVVRRLPLPLPVFCLAAVVGGFVARGEAYPGRFSIHLIPVAVALSMGTIALLREKTVAE